MLVYGWLCDLIDVDFGVFFIVLKGKKIWGWVEGLNFVFYYDCIVIE